MTAHYTMPDIRQESFSAARLQRPCPIDGGRWRVRFTDTGLHVSEASTTLYVALACRTCGAHDAATVRL